MCLINGRLLEGGIEGAAALFLPYFHKISVTYCVPVTYSNKVQFRWVVGGGVGRGSPPLSLSLSLSLSFSLSFSLSDTGYFFSRCLDPFLSCSPTSSVKSSPIINQSSRRFKNRLTFCFNFRDKVMFVYFHLKSPVTSFLFVNINK